MSSLPVNIFGMEILLELIWIPNQNQVPLPPLHVGDAPKNQEFLGFHGQIGRNLAQIDWRPPRFTFGGYNTEVGQKSFSRPCKWLFAVWTPFYRYNPT